MQEPSEARLGAGRRRFTPEHETSIRLRGGDAVLLRDFRDCGVFWLFAVQGGAI